MAYNSPSTGDTIAATDITQLIKNMDGTATAGAGEPVKHTKVNDASNYAEDVKQSDTVAGLVGRFSDNDGAVLTMNKDAVIIDKDVTMGAGLKVDGVELGTHNHNAGAGMGVVIPTAGIDADAITEAKIADNAVQTEHIKAGQVTSAKIDATVASAASLVTHAALNAAVHGHAALHYLAASNTAKFRFEVKVGTDDHDDTGNDYDRDVTITWSTAFTAVTACLVSARVSDLGDNYVNMIKGYTFDTSGAVVKVNVHQGTVARLYLYVDCVVFGTD